MRWCVVCDQGSKVVTPESVWKKAQFFQSDTASDVSVPDTSDRICPSVVDTSLSGSLQTRLAVVTNQRIVRWTIPQLERDQSAAIGVIPKARCRQDRI